MSGGSLGLPADTVVITRPSLAWSLALAAKVRLDALRREGLRDPDLEAAMLLLGAMGRRERFGFAEGSPEPSGANPVVGSTCGTVMAREAASRLGVSEQAVRRLCRTGRLAAERGPRGSWLIDVDDLERLMEERAV